MIKQYLSLYLSSFYDEVCFVIHDRYMKILLIIIPIFILVFINAMFSNGVSEKIPVALVDHDHTSLSRHIISNINASKGIQLVAMPESVEKAKQLMRSMAIYAFIEIPQGATRSVIGLEDNAIIIRYNGQFRSTGSTAYSALSAAISDAISAEKNRKLIGLPNQKTSDYSFNVQIMNVSNSQNSYERFLSPIAVPVLLCIALSSAVICSIGRFFKNFISYKQWIINSERKLIIDILGRITVYITVFFLWNLVYWLYQTKIIGWPIFGNSWVLILAIMMLCILTACIAVMFTLLTQNTLSALSISTVYASAALTYSDGTLSVLNASGWTKFWANFQPFTHYYRIQLEQVNLGSDFTTSLIELSILSLYIIIPLLISLLIIKYKKYKRLPSENEEIKIYNSIKLNFLNTLSSIKSCKPIFSTAILSLLLYSFFYPMAYESQVNIKLPIAIVDLDQSSLSRKFIDNLQSTREINVIKVENNSTDALTLLKNRKVSAVIIIDQDFKKNIIRKSEGNIDVHLSGGYMAMSSDLRNVINNTLKLTRDSDYPSSKGLNNQILNLPLYNTTLGYETYIMPLVFIIILQQTLLLGSSMLIGLRNSYGLLKNTNSQFIGTFLALLTIGVLGTSFVFGYIYWLNGYPNEGNIFIQLCLMFLFSSSVCGLGILIGSFFDNINRPLQLLSATSMIIFYSSGAAFPKFNMPDWIVYFMGIFPSSTMIDGFSMINSQGATAYELLPIIIKMSFLAIIFFLLAWYRLVWKHRNE